MSGARLRRDVQEAGHINYTKRIPATFKFEPHDKRCRLYDRFRRTFGAKIRSPSAKSRTSS